MLTGVFNDLATTLQYVIPVPVSVRYTKHPLASEPGLKRHINPVGEEVIETPITLNVPKTKYSIQYMSHLADPGICGLKLVTTLYTSILICAINHGSLINASKFSFPNALYATMETLKCFIGGKERVILIMPPVAE